MKLPWDFFNQWKVKGIVLDTAKKQKHIIYGRQAMNVQLPGFLKANTQDYDIYSKKPRQAANKMQAKLDKEVAMGEDVFFMKPAQHKGTYRVMNKGPDRRKNTKDDYEVVDYTKSSQRVPYHVIDGIRYESLGSIEKGKRRILKDPESEYRHDKDRGDLQRIAIARRFRRRI